jgi:cytochrome c biogenesis protein CcdA
MYLYLFMAGSYGIGWVIKDLWFPDASFMQKASIASHAGLGLFLATYWMIPVPLAAGYGISSPSTARTIAILVIYLLGMVLMFGADYQKTTTLRHRKGNPSAI